jgi:hypothetical protein
METLPRRAPGTFPGFPVFHLVRECPVAGKTARDGFTFLDPRATAPEYGQYTKSGGYHELR